MHIAAKAFVLVRNFLYKSTKKPRNRLRLNKACFWMLEIKAAATDFIFYIGQNFKHFNITFIKNYNIYSSCAMCSVYFYEVLKFVCPRLFLR